LQPFKPYLKISSNAQVELFKKGGSQMSEYLEKIGATAKAASAKLAIMPTNEKNRILNQCAQRLLENCGKILSENQKDLLGAPDIKASFKDRLTLDKKRVESMAEGLAQVAALDDPVGEVLSMKTLPNGLIVGQRRVPIGVIAIIYEARPNVTADAFGLCFKAGSSVILRGGKEAVLSNKAIADTFRRVLEEGGHDPGMLQLIEDTSRQTAQELMKLNSYVDLLIPRGGAGLIQSVIQNSTVPVVETGVGNCHIFVDASADRDMAISIVLNAKTQRPGVCNAAEKLLVHKDIARSFLPDAAKELIERGVELRGDEEAKAIVPGILPAAEEDWDAEYLELIMGIKVVGGLDEAISHIQRHSSHHSEAIVTESYSNAQRFLNEVDSAAVYVNASTRFTDGFEFGFGAEIGISTQKLHARGPMGLKELTSSKYVIYGSGQTRK
jgi:glutamate-5-semialdehyde dehydrogenase